MLCIICWKPEEGSRGVRKEQINPGALEIWIMWLWSLTPTGFQSTLKQHENDGMVYFVHVSDSKPTPACINNADWSQCFYGNISNLIIMTDLNLEVQSLLSPFPPMDWTKTFFLCVGIKAKSWPPHHHPTPHAPHTQASSAFRLVYNHDMSSHAACLLHCLAIRSSPGLNTSGQSPGKQIKHNRVLLQKSSKIAVR